MQGVGSMLINELTRSESAVAANLRSGRFPGVIINIQQYASHEDRWRWSAADVVQQLA